MWIDVNLWKEVLTNPAETFKKEEKNVNLTEGVKQLIVAGVIAGVFYGISAAFALNSASMLMMGKPMMEAGAMGFIGALIGTPIATLIGWFIFSAILYVIAKLLNGKGTFDTHMYLIALLYSPIVIIQGVLSVIPIVGAALGILVSLYGLYLLTIAIKQAHKVSTEKAVVIWLIPVIVIALILAAMVVGGVISALTL